MPKTTKTKKTTAEKGTERLPTKDPLTRKAEEVEELLSFVDSTSFAGDEREVADELSAVDQHPADIASTTLNREVDYTIKQVLEDEAQQTYKQEVVASRAVVASNHPMASAAGVEMLVRGGNAVDGAIASLFALTVVEPMMVSPFGGGFFMIRDGRTGDVVFLDDYPAV